MSSSRANCWVGRIAAGIVGVSLSGGQPAVAGMAAIMMLYACVMQKVADEAQHNAAVAAQLQERNDALVVQDLMRQHECERLVALAEQKIGQANMVIKGTRL